MATVREAGGREAGRCGPRVSRHALLRWGALGSLGLAAVGLLTACGSGTVATTATPAAATTSAGHAQSATSSASAAPATTLAGAVASRTTSSSAVASTGSPTAAAAKAAGAGVKLVFVTTGSAADGTALFKPVYDRFEQVHPDISVEWSQVNPPGGWPAYFEKITALIAGNSQLDIATIATEGMRLAAANGFIIPLDPYVSRGAGLRAYFDDVSPILKQVAVYAGKTYGLPVDFNSRFIYLNLNRLKQEGLDIPPESWTYTDLRQYAQKLTRRSGAQTTHYGFQVNVSRSFEADPYFFNYGVPGPLAGDAMDKPTMADPNFLVVVQFLQDLIIRDGSSPAPAQKVNISFTDGTLAMFSGNRGSANTYQKQKFNDFAVQFFPKGTTRATEVGCNFWPIFAASKYQEQAWTFESFLLQPDNILQLELGGGNVAALRSVAYNPRFTTVPTNNGKIWYECVDRSDMAVESVVAPPDFNQMDALWGKSLQAMVAKNGDISGDVAQLQQQLQAMIAQRPASWAAL